MMEKPLRRKSYGSIPHLPGSRLGPADRTVHEGQARICTEKTRDQYDWIVVQEKLDGGNVAVSKVGGEIVALGRSGYFAATSPYVQHKIFAAWVERERDRFDGLLREGERVVGEWLIQAHGTVYDLPHEPFVAFDLMVGTERATVGQVHSRTVEFDFVTPAVLHAGPSPLSIADAMAATGDFGHHGAFGGAEGAVWRVERNGKVDFLAKYVRPDKVDGLLLPEISGNGPVWNTHTDHDWVRRQVEVFA